MNPNSLCDTHFHLSLKDDIPSIIKRAEAAGVTNLILSCCDLKNIKEGLEIIKKYPNLYLTIGLHPDEVADYSEDNINYLEDLIVSNNRIIGIGEIGLDYYHNKDNKEEQKALFKAQLELASKHKLPVVIHSRDAFNDTYNILKEYNLKTTIHCFSGSLETAKLYIKEGYLLGIGGVLTFKDSKLKEVIKEIPLNHIVLETDSPYLTPEPYRGEKNEPKMVSVVCECISQLINVPKNEIVKITTNNVIKQYNLSKK